MKKQSLRIFITASLLAILTAASAHAQDRGLKANIPFNFTAGSKTLSAGVYTLRRINPATNQRTLIVEAEEGRMSQIVMTTSSAPNQNPSEVKLVFNRYGDRYFLSEVWTESERRELQMSRAERTLARNQSAPERVTVALNSR